MEGVESDMDSTLKIYNYFFGFVILKQLFFLSFIFSNSGKLNVNRAFYNTKVFFCLQLCDLDNDGILNDMEINYFQVVKV